MQENVPTSAEAIWTAQTLVLTDLPQFADAIFIHGSPVRSEASDDAVINRAAEIFYDSADCIVINGMTADECDAENVAYRGVEAFEVLLRLHRLSDAVRKIPSSKHTGLECENLIALAKQENWRSVILLSQPHHILRCMLTMLAQVRKSGYKLDFYAAACYQANWRASATKPVIGGKIEGKRFFDLIKSELDRIDLYKDPKGITPHGRTYMPHATVEELIHYMMEERGK